MAAPPHTDPRTAIIHGTWMLAAVVGAAGLGRPLVLVALALPAMAWWVWRHRASWLDPPRFGVANWITTARIGLVACIAGLGTGPLVPWGGAIVLLVFALDGLDGWWARRTGTTSSFGAAFDQEADALLVALVSVVAVQAELVPWWVLVAGALRYAYMVVVWSLRMHGEAPRSPLARYVFGGWVIALAAVLLRPHPFTRHVAALASAVLVGSFVRSLWWSWRGPSPGVRQ